MIPILIAISTDIALIVWVAGILFVGGRYIE